MSACGWKGDDGGRAVGWWLGQVEDVVASDVLTLLKDEQSRLPGEVLRGRAVHRFTGASTHDTGGAAR